MGGISVVAATPGQSVAVDADCDRIEIDYLKPALMDDLLTIETSLVAIGGASIEFRQLALRGEEAMAKALVGVVALSNGRPARLPRDMRARLSAPKL